ncbi:esterase family protein [Pontibacillus sp. ALD_SL1]|uniref:alpha/beta hydrolase n=1 Tax=Pontibacillus sp. ALD_SL1 TaxID=2777185 RepID=UPI001A968ED9|nr:alpha/beta hydrolase-fold protein [Pontibacillus sp. ALD_SL1]QST00854.1 esterase family protein [Pontibacillus sp. ALD_SL1]
MGRKGTMTDQTIDSEYLNETLTVKIYKPETFSPLYKYNICIMQDGDDYMQLGRVATLSDRFHGDQTIENTIFVGIHYKDKYDRREKYHPEGKNFTSYMKFLAMEVVPLLDVELPTYHMGGSRALMGDSLGGTMALMTALRYPHTFGKVIMQSPYVDETVLQEAQDSDALSTMEIYHTIGTKETEVSTTDGNIQDFLTPNRKLYDILEEKCQSYTYHELDGEHTWKYWQKDLKRALPTMFGSENP